MLPYENSSYDELVQSSEKRMREDISKFNKAITDELENLKSYLNDEAKRIKEKFENYESSLTVISRDKGKIWAQKLSDFAAICVQSQSLKDEMVSKFKNIREDLKKQNEQPEEDILDLKKGNESLKKQNIKLEESKLDLVKENENLKKQLKDMNLQIRELLYNNRHSTTDSTYELKKSCSYEFHGNIKGILELISGEIACFTDNATHLLKICDNNSLKLSESFPAAHIDTFPIQQGNGNIIFAYDKDLTICNENFDLIENLKESNSIWSLCNISQQSFAIGLSSGTIKIYSKKNKNKNNSNETYFITNEYKHHSGGVWTLLYLPKQKYLLSGSKDETINVLSLFEEKLIETLTGHSSYVSSFLSINDQTFASGSNGEIKIWSIKDETIIECIRTLNAHEKSYYNICLYHLGNDYMVSRTNDDREFKIWDVKNFKCLRVYKEDSEFHHLIVTKSNSNSNSIITGTKDKKVNFWHKPV
jgi:WD40 repeat protein